MEAGKAKDNDNEDILANNPRAINVAEFASARAAELKTMTESVMTMGGMRRTFQKLPRHLRRRAMSHDLRRLPKRLRDTEERNMHKSFHPKKTAKTKEGGGTDEDAPPTKRSRRHRRRPGNLRQEYQRRQDKHKWLETHIWHAKRFKMAELWGCKIPLHPSDKSVRATYRAMAKHCLLQDISYMQVIEVAGPQGLILKALAHLTSPSTGPTCAADYYLTGLRHGETMFYANNRFPEGAVGPVSFLWRAEGETTVGGRGGEMMASVSGDDKYEKMLEKQLWLWAHPSCASEVLKELLIAAERIQDKDSGCRVRVRQLEDSPLRLRLRGPLSHPVFLDALKTADVNVTAPTSDQSRTWWEDYYAAADKMKSHEEQGSTWKALQDILTASDLPPRSVLGLTVRDPRNLIPDKKLKIMTEADEFVQAGKLLGDVLHRLPPAVATSPIWEESVRHSVTATQMSIHKLNTMRSERLVPGQELNLGREGSRVPVLLLQQPGITQSAAIGCPRSRQQGTAGFGSGWDVILPKGWGMAFWIALIFRGARAAGLQASHSCHLQKGLPHFPESCPDAAAGQEWEDKVEQDLTKKFYRWPPAKRPNYGKLGVVSPFRCPWKELLEEWRDAKKEDMEEEGDTEEPSTGQATNESSNIKAPFKEKALSAAEASIPNQAFYVLRERSKLEHLNKALSATSSLKVKKPAPGTAGSTDTTSTSNGGHSHSAMNTASGELAPGNHNVLSNISPAVLHQQADRALVGVRLRMANRGVPHPFAMICLPEDSDIASFTGNRQYCPSEPIHKEFKLNRSVKKKTKRQKGEKNKPKGEDTIQAVKSEVAPKRKLFDSCSRKVIGFVTDGANAFISGSGQAVGYCCMLGLLRLVKERAQVQRNLVLVRDTKAVQYRFAYMDIII